MKKEKSLIETNKYLKDEKVRASMILDHAIASARIEGVPNPARLAEEISDNASPRRFAKRALKRT